MLCTRIKRGTKFLFYTNITNTLAQILNFYFSILLSQCYFPWLPQQAGVKYMHSLTAERAEEKQQPRTEAKWILLSAGLVWSGLIWFGLVWFGLVVARAEVEGRWDTAVGEWYPYLLQEVFENHLHNFWLPTCAAGSGSQSYDDAMQNSWENPWAAGVCSPNSFCSRVHNLPSAADLW